jgi:uncharacterized membrane protein YfcA
MLDITPAIALMLFATGIIAGICNAVAGGGTFFTFPAFLAAGVPPVIANASNAVAVLPGHALALVGYRKQLTGFAGSIKGSIVVAFIGGATGAAILASMGNESFSKLIPFLILTATLLFAFGPNINQWLRRRAIAADFANPKPLTRLLELLFAIYGGFFGAGLGVLLMAGLQMLGVSDVHANNALKNLLAAVVTTVSATVLALSGLISWPHTAVAFLGAVMGGLMGGHIARAMSPALLRRIVIGLGGALTLYYFNRYW